jgi:hypothetical protein
MERNLSVALWRCGERVNMSLIPAPVEDIAGRVLASTIFNFTEPISYPSNNIFINHTLFQIYSATLIPFLELFDPTYNLPNFLSLNDENYLYLIGIFLLIRNGAAISHLLRRTTCRDSSVTRRLASRAFCERRMAQCSIARAKPSQAGVDLVDPGRFIHKVWIRGGLRCLAKMLSSCRRQGSAVSFKPPARSMNSIAILVFARLVHVISDAATGAFFSYSTEHPALGECFM